MSTETTLKKSQKDLKEPGKSVRNKTGVRKRDGRSRKRWKGAFAFIFDLAESKKHLGGWGCVTNWIQRRNLRENLREGDQNLVFCLKFVRKRLQAFRAESYLFFTCFPLILLLLLGTSNKQHRSHAKEAEQCKYGVH